MTMDSQKLQCPCGHRWESPVPDEVPADIREICPVCTPGIQAASHPTVTNGAPPGTDLKPGDNLSGFEIIRPLNRGGMGIVYKARQTDLNRLVALKVVAPERLGSADQAEYLERFRREVRAAAMLNHPNIVTVFATDLTGPRLYLAMEFVDGIDLYRLVRTSGRLSIVDSCEYIRQAALGLQHAFDSGIVHRDIKPHNLMVTPSPSAPVSGSGVRRKPLIKILDMGLARLNEADEALDEGLTRAEAFLGTPDYAAPEQAEDSRLADVRADLYSLGATWFFLLTGEVPFPGVSLMQKLRKQLTQPTPVVTEHRSDIPQVIASIIRKLMDRDPAQRFQTPAELVENIDAYLRDPNWTPDWMAAPPEKLLVVNAHTGSVAAMAMNGDGTRLLSAGEDETLRVWETPSLNESGAVTGDPGPVCAVAITASGKWGASCALRLMSRDMAVQLWDFATGTERRRLRGAKDSLSCIAISFDGRRVVAGDRSGEIHIWALDAPATVPDTIKAHIGTVTGIVFTPDNTAIISSGLDGTVRRWDLQSNQGEELVCGNAGPVRAIAISKTNGAIAVGGELLLLWQPESEIATLAGHIGGTRCVALSADGVLLASGGNDRSVRLWRTRDGSELAAFEGHDGAVRAIAISPDRRFIYSGGEDGTIRRWVIGAAH